MRNIRALFRIVFPPNDWVTLKAIDAVWNLDNDFGRTTEKVMYEIQYSSYRRKYRIKTYGHKPKLHKMYTLVVELQMELMKVNELEQANLNEVNKIINGK